MVLSVFLARHRAGRGARRNFFARNGGANEIPIPATVVTVVAGDAKVGVRRRRGGKNLRVIYTAVSRCHLTFKLRFPALFRDARSTSRSSFAVHTYVRRIRRNDICHCSRVLGRVCYLLPARTSSCRKCHVRVVRYPRTRDYSAYFKRPSTVAQSSSFCVTYIRERGRRPLCRALLCHGA